MLNTINGFDFLLVLVIAGMYIRSYKLNSECESYVNQLIDLSRDNHELTKELEMHYNHMDLDEVYLTSLLAPRTDLSCKFTRECACKDCIAF